MADTQSGLKVHVQTTADTSGLDKTTAGMKNIRGAGESVSRVSERLGKIFKIMFDPISIGVGIAYLAISTLNRKVQEFGAAMEPAKWQGSREVWEEYAKALFQADMAAAKFGRELLTLQNTTESTASATARLLELTRNYARLQGELDNKRKAVDVAKVDALEKQGVITPEEAVQRRAEIDDRYEKERLDKEEAAARKELEIKQQERREIEGGMQGKISELSTLRQQRSTLGSDAMDTKALENARLNASAAHAKAIQMAGQAGGLIASLTDLSDLANPGSTNRRILAQQQIADTEAERVAQLKPLVGTRANERAALDERIKALESDIRTMTQRRGALGTETDQGYRLLNQNLIAADKSRGLDQQLRAITAPAQMPVGPETRAWAEGQVQQGLAAGAGGPNSKLDDVMQQLAGNEVQETGTQLAAVADAINRLLGVVGQALNADDIKRRVEQIEQQLKNNR